jgi:hypothetical protein
MAEVYTERGARKSNTSWVIFALLAVIIVAAIIAFAMR